MLATQLQPRSSRILDNLLCGHNSELVFADPANLYFSKTSTLDIFDVCNGTGIVRSRLDDVDTPASPKVHF